MLHLRDVADLNINKILDPPGLNAENLHNSVDIRATNYRDTIFMEKKTFPTVQLDTIFQ